MYYKLRQVCVKNWGSFFLLQIRANLVTNLGSFIITDWGKCCYQLGQLLQIRVTVITNWGRYYKLGQLLQNVVFEKQKQIEDQGKKQAETLKVLKSTEQKSTINDTISKNQLNEEAKNEIEKN